MGVNKDERWCYVILTDEKQLLYVTTDAEEAFLMKDDWEATHAAEAELIECSAARMGWKPDFPPNADVKWPIGISID